VLVAPVLVGPVLMAQAPPAPVLHAERGLARTSPALRRAGRVFPA
jgi:hypothetical protein